MKRIIIVFSTLIFFITIAFIWNEWHDFSLSKKINADKVSSYFTAVGSLIAALSLFFLYSQLQEMRTQLVEMRTDRSASVKPLLVPDNCNFKLLESQGPISRDTTILARMIMPLLIVDGRPIEGEEGKVMVCNSGLGPAKNIVTSWLYDRDEAYDRMGEYLIEPSVLEYTQKQFLMPSEKMEIRLPGLYLTKLGRHNLKAGQYTYLDGFGLKFKVLYSDIHDNSFSLVYGVKVFMNHGELELKFMSDSIL